MKNITNKYVKSFLKLKNINEENYGKLLNMTEEEIPSGLLMLNSQKFIDRIIELIQSGARIVVVGDYDADGVTGTTVMVRSLRLISKLLTGKEGKISFFIPHRFNDGYGISKGVIDQIKAKNPKAEVLITVDNGIVAFDAVDYAKSIGLEVIITDHHQSVDTVPDAEIIVNPNQTGDEYPFKGISGCTVVYKLMIELAKQHFPDDLNQFEALVDFVGVSVVSDVMPMINENRVYVKKALDIMNGVGDSKQRFGWAAMREDLIRRNKMKRDQLVTETDFGFTFAPIINAQSRVNGAANIGVETFLSVSTDDIREKVKYMVDTNEERKSISNAAFERINEMDHTGEDVIIILDKSLGEGFIGLVAGKITEKYNRPSIVFTEAHPGVIKGSARSIDGINVIDALRGFATDIAIGMGGHEGAAGLSIPEDKLELFTNKGQKTFAEIIPEDLTRELIPDIIIDADDMNLDLIYAFEEIGPFGPEFEFPLFAIDNLPVDKVVVMGKEKNHLKIKSDSFDIICWNGVQSLYDSVSESGQIDVVGRPQVNEFMNERSVQIIVSENGLKTY